MGAALAHRGPDDQGIAVEGRSGSSTGGSRSSIRRRPATSRCATGTAAGCSPTTARSSTTWSCGASSSRLPGAATRTPRPCWRRSRDGARTRCRASTACSAWPRSTADRGQLLPRARPLGRQAALLGAPRRRALVRERDARAVRRRCPAPRAARRRRPRGRSRLGERTRDAARRDRARPARGRRSPSTSRRSPSPSERWFEPGGARRPRAAGRARARAARRAGGRGRAWSSAAPSAGG